MRVYALTELGKKLVATKPIDTEEMKLLAFVREGKTATDQELEVRFDNSRTLVRLLIRRGLIQELTSSGD